MSISRIIQPGTDMFFNAERIQQILEHPHLLGHIMGFTKLTEMHSEWIWHLWGQPDGIHPSLQAHRGSYKTTCETQVGPLWWLLFHPDERIGLLRETFTVAAETLRVIEKACKTPEIIHLFYCVQPELGPLKVLENPFGKLLLSCKQSLTKETSIQAHGIDQLPTGTHFDKAIMDDVVTRNDRISKAKRTRTKDSIREVIANIIDPGKSVLHTGTPWDKYDAWELWTKPVDPDEDDDSLTLQAPLCYDVYSTGLLSRARIAKIKRTTTPSLFAANYELKHIADDDQLFKDPVFEKWDPTCYMVAGQLDAKYDGDHTMALTFAARRKDGKIQVHGRIFTENVKTKIPEILRLCRTYKARKLWNELNPDKGYTADLLSRPPKDGHPPLLIKRYQETLNKHNKIVSYLLEYWDELIFDPECDEAYIAQILDYRQDVEPDDGPDSLASLLHREFYPVDPERSKNNALNDY